MASSSPDNTTFPAYIVNVHPLLVDNNLIWDIYYLRESSSELYCLRIFNIQLSFLVARLPQLTISQFRRYINSFIDDDTVRTFIRTDLTDGSYFNFGRNREYVEIFAPNPKTLSDIYKNMQEKFKSFYARIRENELTPDDALFYRNTETPFRYTSSTTNLLNTVYNLSTKYKIPLVGGVRINKKYLTKHYPKTYLPTFDEKHIIGLNAQHVNAWNPITVNQNITLCLKQDDTIDFKHNFTMFAYDIETYNPDGNLDPTIDDYYIFCIGIGIFDLTNTVPKERYCLISKNIETTVVNPDTNVELKTTTGKAFNRKCVTVYNEYQNYVVDIEEKDNDVAACEDDEVEDIEDIAFGGMMKEAKKESNGGSNDVDNNGNENEETHFDDMYVHDEDEQGSDNVDDNVNNNDNVDATNDEHTNKHNTSLNGGNKTKPKSIKSIPDNDYVPLFPDKTTYIICKNECDLLYAFIEITMHYRPQLITGFNTFGFDDNYMYTRMEMHALTTEYLQCFTFYDIIGDEDLSTRWWFKPFLPEFKQFDLKIDNEPRHDNKSIRAWSVLNIDVYKMMLKEDPKRFTQYGRGNLDTMLEVYNIHNPFNNQPLSKTGLKIHEMYRRWVANENIYSIALYCCQDSWITGTLLIKRAKLSDLIEMAGISYTMLNDSIYHADGIRVSNCILAYAYEEKFAVMDTAYKLRSDVRKDPTTPRLGGKHFDHRTIVGGQVRNIHAGRQWFVVALDYSAMYPSQKEASNIDSSSRVDDDIMKHPDQYGIEIVRKLDINDMYGKREIFYVKKKDKKESMNEIYEMTDEDE